MYKHRYFNVDGVEVNENENDGRNIYHILKTTPANNHVYLWNGNIKVNLGAKGNKRFEVIVLYANVAKNTTLFSIKI